MRHCKVKVMKLESLANELLLDLFDLLSTVDILYAFNGLNSRFNALLFTYYRAYRLDFRSVSKSDFDLVCQQYLPSIADRIISLYLSNDDETPGQIEYFLSLVPNFRSFSNLKSLSLYDLDSKETMNKLLNECLSLTHLNLRYSPDESDSHSDRLHLFDRIWSLPKLIRFCLSISTSSKDYFIPPTVVSLCLQHLSIRNFPLRLPDLTSLFEQTPHLRYLRVDINDKSDEYQLPFVVSSITSLKLCFKGTQKSLTNLLQNMPNLYHLTIDTHDIKMDGYQWEYLIVHHLHGLKIFRFEILVNKSSYTNTKEQIVDKLLESFRSHFWQNERQWFVRCRWHLNPSIGEIYVYSWPYGSDNFYFSNDFLSKSTCPNDDAYWSYDRVRNLFCSYQPLDVLLLHEARFVNIRHLTINLSVDSSQWCLCPKLDQLTSLKVTLVGTNTQALSQLQTLLDRAPRLYSLILTNLATSDVHLAKMTTASVRQLHIIGVNTRFFNANYLLWLDSPLASQCTVLRIELGSIAYVLDIVNKMGNLRALNAFCKDSTLVRKNSFDEWLMNVKESLPSTCLIVKKPSSRLVRLWIR